jgi:hypothetical protein
MVFLIHRTQNKDSLGDPSEGERDRRGARGASNRLIDVEARSEKDLQTLE